MHGIELDLYKEKGGKSLGKPLSEDESKRAKSEVEKILKEKRVEHANR